MNTRVSSQISYLALCFVLAFLPTCGGGGGSSEHSGTGSVTVMLHVAKDSGTTLAQIDCGETGVVSIEAEIFDETNTLIASGGPWACDLHQGKIANVPAGCGRTIVGIGRGAEGEIRYLGEVSGFCVLANQENAVTLTLIGFFPPFNLSPGGEDFFCADPDTGQALIEFNWASNWNRHILQVDDNDDFSSPEINEVVFGTSYQTSLPTGNYYWRVRATSSIGDAQTDWSDLEFFGIGLCF